MGALLAVLDKRAEARWSKAEPSRSQAPSLSNHYLKPTRTSIYALYNKRALTHPCRTHSIKKYTRAIWFTLKHPKILRRLSWSFFTIPRRSESLWLELTTDCSSTQSRLLRWEDCIYQKFDGQEFSRTSANGPLDRSLKDCERVFGNRTSE